MQVRGQTQLPRHTDRKTSLQTAGEHFSWLASVSPGYGLREGEGLPRGHNDELGHGPLAEYLGGMQRTVGYVPSSAKIKANVWGREHGKDGTAWNAVFLLSPRGGCSWLQPLTVDVLPHVALNFIPLFSRRSIYSQIQSCTEKCPGYLGKKR